MGYAETQQEIIQSHLRSRPLAMAAPTARSAPAPAPSRPRPEVSPRSESRAQAATMRTTPRSPAGVAAGGGADADLAAAVAAARGVHVAAEVEEIVAAAGMTMADLRAPSRKRELVEVRRIVAAYLRRRGCSLPEIGRVLNRDHSTVLYLPRTTVRTEARCA